MHPLTAQRVDIRVSTDVDGRPAFGALLAMIDSAGRTVAERLVLHPSERLAAPHAGRFTVRVRRIGFEPFMSDAFFLGEAADTTIVVRLDSRRFVLPRITVLARGKPCRRGESRSAQAAILWEQVTTALVSAKLTAADSLTRSEAIAFERSVSRSGQLVSGASRPIGRSGWKPFGSLSAKELAENGYVLRRDGELHFYAPDVEALLSEEFLEGHCLRVASGVGPSDQLGLAFEPVRDRRLPGIAGTLWLDGESLRLLWMDFSYVNLELPAPAPRTGGWIRFDALPSGRWYVQSWLLRMPLFRESLVAPGRTALAGYIERGATAHLLGPSARVALAPLAENSAWPRTEFGRILGVVVDSVFRKPLAGATVTLSPGGYVTTSNELGSFRFDSVPAGFYRAAARHPRIDSIGLDIGDAELEVAGGATLSLHLATPSVESLRGNSCDSSLGLLSAMVRDVETSQPPSNARIRVNWIETKSEQRGRLRFALAEAVLDADSLGRVLGCFPVHRELSVKAEADSSASGAVAITIGDEGLATASLYVGQRDPGRARPTATLLLGSVRDTSGRRLAGAVIELAELSRRTTTDSSGDYRLEPHVTGSHTVSVRMVGYAPIDQVVNIRGRERRDFIMTRVATLEGMTVTAAMRRSRARMDYEERRRAGAGYALDEAGIRATGATNLVTILQALPTLVVQFQPKLVSERATPDRPDAKMQGELIVGFQRRGFCLADVYVDGKRRKADVLQSIPPAHIAAIEVYPSPSTAPFTYVTLGTGCGIVLVWTKGLGW